MTVNEIIDLTDDLSDEPSTNGGVVKISVSDKVSRNGATAKGAVALLVDSLTNLPELPFTPTYELQSTPPQPQLGICKATGTGYLTLAWHISPGTLAVNEKGGEGTPAVKIKKYELWTCLEPYQCWKKVADINALPPPMSCTLSQIKSDVVNFFIIRAVDVDGRLGPFSLPCNFTQQS
uniref:Activating transcription factor 7-interacting protein 1 n=2 Tax=Lygus hesperus TaxID=30085 RepID=A0A0A9X3P5_LYGHE